MSIEQWTLLEERAKTGLDTEIREAIGKADLCEISAALFAFPTESLAQALSNGSIRSDVLVCLEDAGVSIEEAKKTTALFDVFLRTNSAELFRRLRKGNSLLLSASGTNVPVWPYESPFVYVESGRQGAPSLMRTPIALDVEKQMKEINALPENYRVEPVDSIWNEMAFLSQLYGGLAESLLGKDEDNAQRLRSLIASFVAQHAAWWMPSFFTQLKAEAENGEHLYGEEYAVFAAFGKVVATVLFVTQ